MQKKVTFLLFLMLCAGTVFGQINVGGGFVYGTGPERAGMKLNGQYFVMENLAIAPSFQFYFPQRDVVEASGFGMTTRSEARSSFLAANADVNYYFFQDVVDLYALAGLNFSAGRGSAKTFLNDEPFGDPVTSSSSAIGFNIGVGAEMDLELPVKPFFSIKYTLSELDQLVIGLGVRYTIQ